MNTLKRFNINNLILIISVSFLLSCSKNEDEPKAVITVTTSSISQITKTSAKSGGSITITGNANIDGKGVCWSTSSNPTVSLTTKTADGTGSSSYISNITSLTANTTYYVRAYVTYGEDIVYGNQVSFTSLPNPVAPTITTVSLTNVQLKSVTLGGKVNANGFPTTSVKFEYGTTTSYGKSITLDNVIGNTSTDVTANISNLSPNTTYHYRLVATNAGGVAISNDMTFHTLDYAIGVECDGGIIAYIYQPGDNGYDANQKHGLIVAKNDTSSVKWAYAVTGIGTLENGLNKGKDNTEKIIYKNTSNNYNQNDYAAKMCKNKGDGWFLPSIDELEKVLKNKTPNMNFDYDNKYRTYWSSSESDYISSTYAYNYNIYYSGGVQTISKGREPKNIPRIVRAVRYF